MLARWCNEIFDINLALSMMHRVVQGSRLVKGGRGAKPKRNVDVYALVIAMKEYDERTLWGAEEHITRFVYKERIDHSVLSYWENKKEMPKIIAKFIGVAGAMLDKCLSSLFTFVDSTKFTSWKIRETEVTVCNRVAEQTVYPVGISFQTKTVHDPVMEAVPNGQGKIKADAWYDANKALGVMYQKGYTPIVCPHKGRLDGYWRRKARKVYKLPENKLAYRQRGRGESVFGSLTNQFGDRLNVCKKTAMQTRIAARIFCYQIKILIRAKNEVIILIVRHALKSTNIYW